MSIKTTTAKIIANAKFGYMKNKPTIWLIGAGIAGAGCIGATVFGTVKAVELDKKSKEERETVERVRNEAEANNGAIYIPDGDAERVETYTEKDYKKDVTKCRVRRAARIAACYIPTVLLGGLSVMAVLASHGEMKRREASAVAGAAAIKAAYDSLSKAVKDKYGENAVDELTGVTNGEHTDIIEKDISDGVKATEEKTTPVAGHGELRANQRWWSESEWHVQECGTLMNEQHLKQTIRDVNNKYIHMRHKTYITFNEELEALGFKAVEAGIGNGVTGTVSDEELNPLGITYREVKKPLNDGTNDFWTDYLVEFPITECLFKSNKPIKGLSQM